MYFSCFEIDLEHMQTYFPKEHPKENIISVAFYNLENLYDIFDDPNANDNDFTPYGDKKWTLKRYKNKIEHLGEVISQIGLDHAEFPPIVVGIAEVENEKVVMDLVQNKHLTPYQYGYIHFNSFDERGIEVALLYQKERFELVSAERFPIMLYNPDGSRDYTRDVLVVEGKYQGESLCFFINHWPSRREGLELSEYKRIEASLTVADIINQKRAQQPDSKLIVMGDFNDEPDNESIKNLVKGADLYNAMDSLHAQDKGSCYSQDQWYLFDQILVSPNLFGRKSHTLTFKYADVFDPRFIKTWKGKRKDAPFRTYSGKWHLGGFSDHFPVVAYLERCE